MKPLKAAPKMTPPKWDDFFNLRVMKAAESLPCINVVFFCRTLVFFCRTLVLQSQPKLVTLAVTARWRASARAQQRLVTAVVGYQSYFHLACISNSAEHFASPVPIPALDTHIRAENVALAPPALIPSWAPVGGQRAGWSLQPLQGHHISQCGHWSQEQWENSTTCQVCLGGWIDPYGEGKREAHEVVSVAFYWCCTLYI